jgi:hypothetical protein
MDNILQVCINSCKQVEKILGANHNFRKGSKQNFNFFYGLVRDTHLEKYHSNFIRYLLDPNESHDFGTFFLKKFIKRIKLNRTIDLSYFQIHLLDIENALVERERPIAKGRIDILIQPKNNNKEWVIYIENKFWSIEGDNQMRDYYDCFTKTHSKSLGIYLTPDGELPPSIKDYQDAEKKIICLSYKKDIIPWLENCLADQELVRYSHITNCLMQYIDATKQTLNIMDNKEMNEIKEFLKGESQQNLSAIIRYQKHLEQAVEEIIKSKRDKFLESLKKATQAELKSKNIQCDIESKHLNCKYNNLEFLLKIDQAFPKIEDQGRGLWWGIYGPNKNIKCGLEYGHWQSVILKDIQDHKDDTEGSIKILEEENNELAQSAAKNIMESFTDKLLSEIEIQMR